MRIELRQGHTFRVYDIYRGESHVMAIALDHQSYGGVYSPGIHVYHHGGYGYRGGYSWHILMPYLPWKIAYKFRRIGAMEGTERELGWFFRPDELEIIDPVKELGEEYFA
jgi:hypothetical protein